MISDESRVEKHHSFIVAELSANHNRDFSIAVESIKAIADTGADAVKVQTYKPESLTFELDSGLFARRTKGLWKGYTSWELYEEAAMPYDWQPKLKRIAEDLGLVFFSSPFDFEGVDFLESIDCPIYKIASFEIVDIPLIKYVAATGKPIIISTGIARLSDIELALDVCKSIRNHDLTLLKCTSAYPAPYNEINLRTIPSLKEIFNTRVGLSDHTLGIDVPLGAVALGAEVIEKHFILDRKMGGVDSSFSLEPQEFKGMVEGIRHIEDALGTVDYDLSPAAKDSRNRGRSLFVAEDIKKGESFTAVNVRSIRPADGLHPKHYWEILGRKAKSTIKKGTPLSWSDVE